MEVLGRENPILSCLREQLAEVEKGIGNIVNAIQMGICNDATKKRICGAKGCIRACMNMLEKADRIESKFHNKFYYKKSWSLSNKPEAVSDGVNPYREEFLDRNYPGIRKNEYKKTE